MHYVQIGYKSFAIDDEHALHLYAFMANLKPVETQGYGRDLKIFRSEEELDMRVSRVNGRTDALLPIPRQAEDQPKEDLAF